MFKAVLWSHLEKISSWAVLQKNLPSRRFKRSFTRGKTLAKIDEIPTSRPLWSLLYLFWATRTGRPASAWHPSGKVWGQWLLKRRTEIPFCFPCLGAWQADATATQPAFLCSSCSPSISRVSDSMLNAINIHSTSPSLLRSLQFKFAGMKISQNLSLK